MTIKIWRVHNGARRCRIIALWTVIGLFLPSLCLGADLTIEIGQAPVLPCGTVLLRDLARIACDDPELLYRASVAPVEPGEALCPMDITRALGNAGIGGVSVKLTMADKVGYRLESSLESAIKQFSGWSGILIAGTDRPIPKDAEIVPPDRLYPGVDSINLRIREDETERVVPVRLRWFISAVVSRNPIRRSDPITAADLAIDRIRFERNQRYFSDPRLLVGMSAARDMAKSQPFTVRTTDEPQAVSSGDTVKIVYKKGSLIVWAPGRALAAGAIGDVIRVRNQRTKSVVLATVTGPGTVEVSK